MSTMYCTQHPSQLMDPGLFMRSCYIMRHAIPFMQSSEPGVRMQILGMGSLKVKVTVAATQFSESARAKIEEAGGSIVEVP